MKNIIEIQTTQAGGKISLEIEYKKTTVKHGYNEVEQIGSLATSRKTSLMVGSKKFADHGWTGKITGKGPQGRTHYIGGAMAGMARVALTTEEYEAVSSAIQASDDTWAISDDGKEIAEYEAKIANQVDAANQVTIDTNEIENRMAYGEL